MALVNPPRKMYASTISAETISEKSNCQPSRIFNSDARAYMLMPEEKTVMTAKLMALKPRVF